MSTRTVIRWNLRQVMAENGMFATTDLVEPLRDRGVEISRQMIHRIVTQPPRRINVDLLAALCDILNCTTDDLLELVVEHVPPVAEAVNDHSGSLGDIRPARTQVRRPQALE